jgi:hypothetical protein
VYVNANFVLKCQMEIKTHFLVNNLKLLEYKLHANKRLIRCWNTKSALSSLGGEGLGTPCADGWGEGGDEQPYSWALLSAAYRRNRSSF